jgi:hypothetical protein
MNSPSNPASKCRTSKTGFRSVKLIPQVSSETQPANAKAQRTWATKTTRLRLAIREIPGRLKRGETRAFLFDALHCMVCLSSPGRPGPRHLLRSYKIPSAAMPGSPSFRQLKLVLLQLGLGRYGWAQPPLLLALAPHHHAKLALGVKPLPLAPPHQFPLRRARASPTQPLPQRGRRLWNPSRRVHVRRRPRGVDVPDAVARYRNGPSPGPPELATIPVPRPPAWTPSTGYVGQRTVKNVQGRLTTTPLQQASRFRGLQVEQVQSPLRRIGSGAATRFGRVTAVCHAEER